MTTQKKTNIIFAGTPDFAVPFLQTLLDQNNFQVAAVITQPDKPSGRKQILTPPPVKILAEKNKLKIFQPEKLKNDPTIAAELIKLKPDLIIVVAFGQIIPAEILNIPKHDCLNVHPSLLPLYRGASPLPAAILNGDKTTGVSIMLLDEKMDHGPILAQQKITLATDETDESLRKKTTALGTGILINTINNWLGKKIRPREQDHTKATFCPIISREMAKINWTESAETIERKIRAFYPWPITWTTWNNKRIKIFPLAEAIKTLEHENIKTKTAGLVLVENNKLMITCGEGMLIIDQLQIEGKNTTSAKDFILGNKNFIGSILG